MFTSSRLIEEFKTKFGATDQIVADHLGVARSVITEARNGTQELKLEFKLALADKIGYAWARDVVFKLFGSAGVTIKKKDNARLKSAKRPTKNQNQTS
jgi:hypothetical protein